MYENVRKQHLKRHAIWHCSKAATKRSARGMQMQPQSDARALPKQCKNNVNAMQAQPQSFAGAVPKQCQSIARTIAHVDWGATKRD